MSFAPKFELQVVCHKTCLTFKRWRLMILIPLSTVSESNSNGRLRGMIAIVYINPGSQRLSKEWSLGDPKQEFPLLQLVNI